jgi:peptidoglycan hydrolase-like protein with peptidoglycan-binding domain
MANSSYTYDDIMGGSGNYFQQDTSFSPSVRRMQTKLNRLGYNPETADGYFGTNTLTAVKAFQKAQSLTQDGYAGQATLTTLNTLSPDSETENYGRELTHTQLTGGYSNSSITAVEAVARCIFGEDTIYADGQRALAKEINNRRISPRSFIDSGKSGFKGVVYSANQYAVMTGSSSDTTSSRGPNQYSTSWATCVSIAKPLSTTAQSLPQLW